MAFMYEFMYEYIVYNLLNIISWCNMTLPKKPYELCIKPVVYI